MKSIICDIDGVLLRDNARIPGADIFIKQILEQGNPFLLSYFPGLARCRSDLMESLKGYN